MNTPRSYTMTARARSVEQTRTRILAAAVDLHGEKFVEAVGLDDVATRAGVSVQTVLRHFGSRAGLLDAALEHGQRAVQEERLSPVGDVDAAVHILVGHYETRGDAVLLMLAQEHTQEFVKRITDRGRQVHRAWVEEVFAPHLAAHPDPEALTDLLVVATDVYAWKLLRRDRALSRGRTESRITAMVRALVAATADTDTTH